ncbi:MAG TPA: twin-arginine translocation signal domain-containing protein, partial [Casimicrobium sp.]|nr:twin-arginine translocation signal domain-containing protein [Casimicrobium sp.]
MQRRDFLNRAAATAAAGGAVLAAPAVIGQSPAVRWRLTSAFPKSLDTIYGAAEVFAQQVSKMTGGKFQISVHAAGEIVPTPGLVDAVQNGTVEAGHTAPYYYFGKDDTFALGCAIPFGLNSRQMTAWQYE